MAETLLELRRKFGAVSAETQTIIGEWEHFGVVYRDEHLRFLVAVPDSPENPAFFLQFKESLKLRFRQVDIWLTSHPLELL